MRWRYNHAGLGGMGKNRVFRQPMRIIRGTRGEKIPAMPQGFLKILYC
jgi:hypothetical protein